MSMADRFYFTYGITLLDIALIFVYIYLMYCFARTCFNIGQITYYFGKDALLIASNYGKDFLAFHSEKRKKFGRIQEDIDAFTDGVIMKMHGLEKQTTPVQERHPHSNSLNKKENSLGNVINKINRKSAANKNTATAERKDNLINFSDYQKSAKTSGVFQNKK